MSMALGWAGYAIVALLVWFGGNLFTRLVIALSKARKAEKDAQPPLRAGRVIGLLERVLIVTGLVARSWEVIAAVVALKTVARYKDLEDRATAEYFLIGSLASMLWAVMMAGLLLWHDAHAGFGLLAPLAGVASISPAR